MLDHLRYGYRVITASDVWRVCGSSLPIASAMSSNLCGKSEGLQLKAALSRSSTVSVTMQNMGGEFFHPIGRVTGIATKYLFYTSEGGNIPILISYVGRKTIW